MINPWRMSVVSWIRLLRVSALFILLISLLTSCSIPIGSKKSFSETHQALANRYLQLAQTSDHALQFEYNLRAADHLIKAQQLTAAERVLKGLQMNDPALDLTTRHILLEARLSVLKKDVNRAQKLLDTLLKPFLKRSDLASNHSLAGGYKIALLLPSKGPHADAAKTIRDGFLAAYYRTLQHQVSDPNVLLYDTQEGSAVETAYQKAIADKAVFIVGPLTKPEVQTMARLKLDIPVLALNSITQGRARSQNLYQFGLMPEDEIAASVEHARQKGYERALVIAPEGDWGRRMTEAFRTSWEASGGKITTLVTLDPRQAVMERLRAVLEAPNQPPKRGFDMIFLAASPELARQVKPSLNYYASSIPVYASASTYSGTPDPKRDYDLDGIHFCDMPWVLNHASDVQDIRKTVSELWPNSFARAPRYFALGMDAYQLVTQLLDTRSLPLAGISGMTGILQLDNQRIQRKLVCVKFEHGIPIPD